MIRECATFDILICDTTVIVGEIYTDRFNWVVHPPVFGSDGVGCSAIPVKNREIFFDENSRPFSESYDSLMNYHKGMLMGLDLAANLQAKSG